MPAAAAAWACSKALPWFWLPSVTSTIRRAASSGNMALASFKAAAMFVAWASNRVSMRSHIATSSSQRGPLDGGVTAEDDHAGAVLVVAMGADLVADVVDHCRSLLLRNAERLVQQVDHGQIVASADHLHFGRGEDQEHDDEHPRSHRKPAAHVPQSG